MRKVIKNIDCTGTSVTLALAGARDTNRMLIFLDKIMTTTRYREFLGEILNGQMFKNTITINGKTLKISEFLDSSGQTAYQYYHGVDDTFQYFAKMDGDEGVLLVFNKTTKLIEGVVKKITNKELTANMDREETEDD